MAIPLLQLHALSCERDERVLFQGLDMVVSAGDVVQIEGPNGCGKTTLLRILSTISSDYEGELSWQQKPLLKQKFDYLSQLLFIGHLPGIKKSLTPRENLQWFAGLAASHTNIPIETALESVGLYGYEDIPCYQLSAGQLRRVALARLFLSSARVWILDEPFTAIDKQGVGNLEALMTQHAQTGGCVILTTHQDLAMTNVRRINLLDYRSPAQRGSSQ